MIAFQPTGRQMLSAGFPLWEKLSEWYEGSLIKELLEYFAAEYFSVDFGTYDHFSVSASAAITTRNMILALALGIILAAILTAYTRVGLGGFVRRLIKEEALSPDSAKTLHELGYFRSSMIRHAIATGSALRMVVRCPEKEAHEAASAEATTASRAKEKTFRYDFTSARFYIPEDLRARAEIRFETKGSGWLPVVIITVVTIIAASALCFFLPDLLQLADNLINLFQPG